MNLTKEDMGGAFFWSVPFECPHLQHILALQFMPVQLPLFSFAKVNQEISWQLTALTLDLLLSIILDALQSMPVQLPKFSFAKPESIHIMTTS